MNRVEPQPRRRFRQIGQPSVKLSDVAKLAGVSTASASRALNKPDRVSDEIRWRVEVAAKQLNWIPNGAAKALASLKSGTVGALIPSLWHQNFASAVEGLQNELAAEGYTLILGCTAFSFEREHQQALKMIERGIEHLVLLGEAHSPQLFDLLKNRGVGYTIMYTTGTEGKHPCIGFDNYEAYSQVVRHLLQLGHRNFGMISQLAKDNDRVTQRVQAARDVLAAEGLAIRPHHFVEVSEWNITDGRRAFAEIIRSQSMPTALMCTNDYLAAGVLIEARLKGIGVPDMLSVVGFDDIELARHGEPPLTTVRVPDRDMGIATAKYVLDELDGKQPHLPGPLQAEFILRESTAPPPSQ